MNADKLDRKEIIDAAKKACTLDDLVGHRYCAANANVLFDFEITPECIMDGREDVLQKNADIFRHGVCHGNSEVVGVLDLSKCTLNHHPPGVSIPFFWVLHANGVIKFVLDPALSEEMALRHTRLDSLNEEDTHKNISHTNRHGCFCLGILRPDGSIDRYNRWAEDLYFYYTIFKQNNYEL